MHERRQEMVSTHALDPSEEVDGVMSAAGLKHPSELTPEHICRRVSPTDVRAYSKIFEYLHNGELLDSGGNEQWKDHWRQARSDSFLPA